MIPKQNRRAMITVQPQVPMDLLKLSQEIDRVLGFRGCTSLSRFDKLLNSPASDSIQVIPATIFYTWDFQGSETEQLHYLREWLSAKLRLITLVSIAWTPGERYHNG